MPAPTVTADLPDLVRQYRADVAAIDWNTARGFDGTDAQAVLLLHRGSVADAVRRTGHDALVSLLTREREARHSLRVALDDVPGAANDSDGLTDAVGRFQAARTAVAVYLRQHRPRCECLFNCDGECSLSGNFHVHPRQDGIFGPCPVHPDAPGDL